MKKLNLNSIVKVKLTPKGAEIYYHRFDNLNKQLRLNNKEEIGQQMPKIDNDGFTDFVLWQLFELYGNHIGMGKENVFSDVSIYIDDSDICEANL